MTTRVTEGDRRGTTKDDSFFLLGVPPSFLASRGFAAQCSRARALPLLNLKKKRDSSQSKAIRKREEGPPDGRLGWSLSEVCHIPGSSFMSHSSVKLCESAVRRDLSPPYLEGLSGVGHQPSDGLFSNHQPSKKVIFFYCQPSKCIQRLTVKKVQDISNFAVSAAVPVHGILAPEESINWKK